ncbi:MAG: HAD family hydrolase [Negativicutes bacterium]|nr:HAD family hydrolase [Negativicutes bacterium]
MNVFFWDIDGTLIRTNKAGLYAFEQATAELWNKPVDFAQIQTAGMTDNYIAAQIIELITGRAAEPGEISDLTRRYEALIPEHLSARGGLTMPHVREILADLNQRDNCRQLLLTGNSRAGAEIKLNYFGLAGYFDFSLSAFCDRHFSRTDIARCAAASIDPLRSRFPELRAFVIGDTPHDIACGKSIGAYTIGVATGTYSQAELAACEPWWAVDKLPAAAEFAARTLGI